VNRSESRPEAPAATPLDQREFHFDDKDFRTIRQLIHDYAGIALNDSKFEMVYSRLARRMRALKLKRFSDYIARVTGEDEEERQIFINALTTNLTAFFREPHHFTILADYLRYKGIKPPIVIWCAACSTGEEPYSIAMTLAETYGYDADVKVIATDIDTEALESAANGVFPLERLEPMQSFTVKQFFLKGTGKNAGFARVRPELRSMVRFQYLNLREERWDINERLLGIFCRNVMIYFDKPTQYQILQRFVPLLRPEGLLFVGHSESLYHANDLFRMREKTVYQLTGQPDYVAGPPPPAMRATEAM
jgi:chemotaxis protein methyltransferase CheR